MVLKNNNEKLSELQHYKINFSTFYFWKNVEFSEKSSYHINSKYIYTIFFFK